MLVRFDRLVRLLYRVRVRISFRLRGINLRIHRRHLSSCGGVRVSQRLRRRIVNLLIRGGDVLVDLLDMLLGVLLRRDQCVLGGLVDLVRDAFQINIDTGLDTVRILLGTVIRTIRGLVDLAALTGDLFLHTVQVLLRGLVRRSQRLPGLLVNRLIGGRQISVHAFNLRFHGFIGSRQNVVGGLVELLLADDGQDFHLHMLGFHRLVIGRRTITVMRIIKGGGPYVQRGSRVEHTRVHLTGGRKHTHQRLLIRRGAHLFRPDLHTPEIGRDTTLQFTTPTDQRSTKMRGRLDVQRTARRRRIPHPRRQPVRTQHRVRAIKVRHHNHTRCTGRIVSRQRPHRTRRHKRQRSNVWIQFLMDSHTGTSLNTLGPP